VLEIGQTVKVKVLDIDRERQRISLGLKQTQSDPWQQVVEQYSEGDTVEGKVTKVVTFGAFVEILPGVEGLVHISELAPYHVENPREVVSQGDTVKVLILEIDGERRRLSLSMKRVDGAEGRGEAPELALSEEVFAEHRADAPRTAIAEAFEDAAIAAGASPAASADEAAEVAGGTTGDEEPAPESDAAAEEAIEGESLADAPPQDEQPA
jgi:small subunit ribosomal protein S1